MPQHLPYRYRGFGLLWQSALPLPELCPAPDEGGEADVVVRLGCAPRPKTGVRDVVTDVRAGPDSFWMEVPGTARIAVHRGREMVVDAAPGAREGDVRAWLLGSATGALLHQRGLLPLHASAIAIGDRAVVFIAPSGGGKSTMAMHLQHRGHRVICDDLCAVAVTGGSAQLWPGLRTIKLWRASLGAIDRMPDGLEPVLANLDKYRVPVDVPADDRAWDIAAVVMLDWGDAPEVAALPGAAAVGALVANTFRGQLVAPMGREAAHWHQCLELFRATGVHVLARPRALDRLDEASTLVERTVAAASLLTHPAP